ncbi:MAG: FMN reductase [Rickettsiales bacterium]|nr:FMN reductase [Rickettsiales bacterium]
MQLNILGICGSATKDSSNELILKTIQELYSDEMNVTIVNNLEDLPHFQTELTSIGTPETVVKFREQIQTADGVIISSPEYVFSIPSRLKNALEWCVSTTVFTDKPTAIITASASGIKGHEELQMIMQTIQAKLDSSTCLLIQGIKGKISSEGQISESVLGQLKKKVDEFRNYINSI